MKRSRMNYEEEMSSDLKLSKIAGSEENQTEERSASSSSENRDVVPDSIICVVCTQKIGVEGDEIGAEYRSILEVYSASVTKLLKLPEVSSELIASAPVCLGCLDRIRKMHHLFVQIESLEFELNGIVEEIKKCLGAEVETCLKDDALINERLATILSYREAICRNGRDGDAGMEPATELETFNDLADDGDDREFSPENFDNFILNEDQQEQIPSASHEGIVAEASDDLKKENVINSQHGISKKEPAARKSKHSLRSSHKTIVCDYKDPITQKCTLRFNSLLKLEAHLRSHRLQIRMGEPVQPPRKEKKIGGSPREKCPIEGCSQSFCMTKASVHKFVDHIINSHGLFLCQRCDEENKPCFKTFESEEMLESHQNECQGMENEQPSMWLVSPTTEDEALKCGICCKPKLVGRYKLPGHLVKHGYYVCLELNVAGQTCLCAFRSRSQLLSHFESLHAEDNSSGRQMQFAGPNLLLNASYCYTCCQGGLKTKEDFMKHMETHGLFPCGNVPLREKRFCRAYFPNEVSLELHRFSCSKSYRAASSKARKQASCKFCNRPVSFSDRQELINHIKYHNGIVCDYVDPETQIACTHAEVSYFLMRSHRSLKHPAAEESEEITKAIKSIADDGESLAISCKYCDQMFSGRNQEWVSHIEAHGAFICDVVDPESKQMCREVFANEIHLMYHCRKHHSSHNVSVMLFKCTECDFACSHHTRFSKHKQLHSGALEICEICGESFKGRIGYKRHKAKVHKEGTLYHCDLCEKVYSESNLLRDHKKIEHEGFRKVCNICGEVFKTNGRYILHVEKFHERQEFRCSECGKAFPCRRDCLDHEKKVHAERKFSCSICGWSFRRQPMLYNHIQSVHNDVRQFVCDICGAAMKRKAHLLKHKLKHEAGEIIKPYKPRTRRIKDPPLVDQTLQLLEGAGEMVSTV